MQTAEKQKTSMGKKLARLGIRDNRDLLYYFPSRYEKREIKTPDQLVDGEDAVVLGRIQKLKKYHPRPGLHVVSATMSGRGGLVFRSSWFNDFDAGKLSTGTVVAVYGKAQVNGYGRQISVRDWVILNDGVVPDGFTGLIPVYPLVKGVSQEYIRGKVQEAITQVSLPDFLPADIRVKNGLIRLEEAIRQIHCPRDEESLARAKNRLAFDEVFLLQLALRIKGQAVRKNPKQHRYREECILPYRLMDVLPFRLTPAQLKAWEEINNDMSGPYPMRRLLLGDVGSGKTVVIALAIARAVESGYRAVLMVPTEILARQHYETLAGMFHPLGVNVAVAMGARKDDVGGASVVVGTHALIQDGLELERVSLVIVDEQHRFGVEQRTVLQEKTGRPDFLATTATPIPRTLALTIYGDMELSVINQSPPGRKQVKTYLTRDMAKAVEFVRRQLNLGRQAYVVCPLVEESETLDLQNAVSLHDKLVRYLAPFKVALVHGRMKAVEKDAVMREFKAGRVDVLVSTTVVEVGVDVPNATVMVIVDADRFGLAQLHQLRGRVGRGEHESYCIAVSPGAKSEKAVRRLKVFASTTNGFKLAEYDLALRGAGELFGTRQAGLVDFKIARLDDAELMSKARDAALTVKLDKQLINEVAVRYGGSFLY